MVDLLRAIESLERERTQALTRFIELDNVYRTLTKTIRDTVTDQSIVRGPRPGDSLAYADSPPRAVLLVLGDVIPSINRELRVRELEEDLHLWRAIRGWWRQRIESLLSPLGGKFPFPPLKDPVVIATFDDQPYRDIDNYNLKHAVNAFARVGFYRDDRDVVAYVVRRRKQHREMGPTDSVRAEFLIIESGDADWSVDRLGMDHLSRPDLKVIVPEDR